MPKDKGTHPLPALPTLPRKIFIIRVFITQVHDGHSAGGRTRSFEAEVFFWNMSPIVEPDGLGLFSSVTVTIAVTSCNTLAHRTPTETQQILLPHSIEGDAQHSILAELGFEPGDIAYSLAALTLCSM